MNWVMGFADPARLVPDSCCIPSDLLLIGIGKTRKLSFVLFIFCFLEVGQREREGDEKETLILCKLDAVLWTQLLHI
jgi:hypothetical protein